MKKKLEPGEFALLFMISKDGVDNLKLVAKDKAGMTKGKTIYEIIQPHLHSIENEISELNQWTERVANG